jgi:hypothetical protein
MRLALAPKVAVVEEDKVVVEENKVVVEESEEVAVVSSHRHTIDIKRLRCSSDKFSYLRTSFIR